MKHTVILAFDNTMATTIFGPMDILCQAGRLWNRVNGVKQTAYFEVDVASPDGRPVRCQNGITVNPHCALEDIRTTDLIIIASLTKIDRALACFPRILPWLCGQYHRGAHIASICTGVYLLAESGLLDGKTATIHWGFAERFAQRYPRIQVRPERMIIDHGDLFCSAGTNAGLDLSLYLVSKYCGRRTALQCAKAMVLDMGRRLQTPYYDFLLGKNHQDKRIQEIQEKLEADPAASIDYDSLAREHGMSRRSMERRFKTATGKTPLAYLQRLRVEAAKHMLEGGKVPFSQIAYSLGYEDVAFFRKLFTRVTGLRPKEYYLNTRNAVEA